jgi:hypothetical protein
LRFPVPFLERRLSCHPSAMKATQRRQQRAIDRRAIPDD